MLSVLEESVTDANACLAKIAEETESLEGMGTTCIAMMRSGSKLAVANIGDSRAYLRRGRRVTQITKDHSFVQKLLDEGRISEEEALHHPQRSLVTRVLTGREEDGPDLTVRELREGDRLLLCSDGLTDYVAEETVTELLLSQDPPGTVADRLIEISLRASVRDNVTVIVADAVQPGDGTTKPQVVGAASERRGTHGLPALTPAEKAAALAREVHGHQETAPELAEEGGSSTALAWLRRGLIALAVLAVVAAGAWTTYDWSQRQYFVGEMDGQVTVFRGVSQDLGPLELSRPEQGTGIEVAALPAYYQRQVASSLSADDREGADTIVEQLRTLSLPLCEQVTTEDLTAGAAGPAGTDDAAATTGPARPTEECRP
jgi:protein phosphatase